MPNKKKWLFFALLGLISTLIVIFVSTATRIYVYGNESHIIKADAAIVLGAEVWHKQPSPVFRERINHAITLYKNTDVRKIIFTGGVGANQEIAESIVGKKYAIARGVLEADILTESESRTTQQNLKYAQQVAVANQLTKILIVSDPLHLKRAVLMAKNLGMDAYPSPTPTTRYQSLNRQFPFLMRETYFYFVYLLLKI
jgi:uncharacterized SAM-binding protein YcdF (DUF218 family)